MKLLRRQPLGLPAMTVIYLLLHLPALLPVAGMAVATVLAPFATLGLMAACREVASGRAPSPNVYLGLFQNAAQRRALIQLGVANAILTVVALVLMLLMGLSEPLAEPATNDGPLQLNWSSVAAALAFYVPIVVLMWFSPMLVGWHGTPVLKALFGSALACWRNKIPMLVYGVALICVIVAVGAVVQGVLAVLGASAQLVSMVTAPLALVLLAMMQGGFYAMYVDVFEDNVAAAQMR